MFDLPLIIILCLTGFINLIGALAYAARIARHADRLYRRACLTSG